MDINDTYSIETLIHTTHRVGRQLLASKLVPLKITPDEFRAMNALALGGVMSLAQLSRSLRMDNPTMSRMVSELAERGYLNVGPDPKHGRRINIDLTSAGMALCVGPFGKVQTEFHAGSEMGMSLEDYDTLKALLIKYQTNLDAMSAAEPKAPLRIPHAA